MSAHLWWWMCPGNVEWWWWLGGKAVEVDHDARGDDGESSNGDSRSAVALLRVSLPSGKRARHRSISARVLASPPASVARSSGSWASARARRVARDSSNVGVRVGVRSRASRVPMSREAPCSPKSRAKGEEGEEEEEEEEEVGAPHERNTITLSS